MVVVVLGLLLSGALCCYCALLRVGKPLHWTAAKPFLAGVRSNGIQQFVAHYKKNRDKTNSNMLWGDEVEYGIFRKQRVSGPYDLSIGSGAKLQSLLSQPPGEADAAPSLCTWHPEYGSWMIEGVPGLPYGGDTLDRILEVQRNMEHRRMFLSRVVSSSEIVPSTTCFPMMGVSGYNHAHVVPGNDVSASDLVVDGVINPHPRFGTLTRNIRARRGSKVDIALSVDPHPDAEPQSQDSSAAMEGDEIHLDAMAFGMGCCCLQVTLQSRTEDESRYLHDQLAALSPLLHALSASTPIAHGRLLATDTRWGLISQAVDDRTPAERRSRRGGPTGPDSDVELAQDADPMLAGGGVKPLPQSRYSESPLYIARTRSVQEAEALQRLNDVPVPVDEAAYTTLREGGVDDALARHLAHLFVRDPLVIFEDQIHVDNDKTMDHFENIQSTNWRSMRWKPPAPESGGEKVSTPLVTQDGASRAGEDRHATPGWRNEVRTLEIQLTDFENAAFAVLVVLLSKLIVAEGVSTVLPMSLVHENMRRAQQKDAVLTQKFWFRRDLGALGSANKATPAVTHKAQPGNAVISPLPPVPRMEDMDIVEMSINEIMNGQQQGADGSESFPGLMPILRKYIAETFGETGSEAIERVEAYLTLLSRRASGALPTAARWMRRFVTRHPHYERGSGRLTPQIADDLLEACHAIGLGQLRCEELYGPEGARQVPRLVEEVKGKVKEVNAESREVLDAVYHSCTATKAELERNRSCCVSSCG